MKVPGRVLGILLLLSMLGCGPGGRSARSADAPQKSPLVEDVPHLRQKPGFGGEACAAMFLAKLGRNVGQDDVFDASGVDPALGRGCGPEELAAALARIGFKPTRASWPLPQDGERRELEAQFAALVSDLVSGVPSIVAVQGEHDPATPAPFLLVLGFDGEKGDVVYHDPFVRDGAYRRIASGEFVRRWPGASGRAGRCVVRIPLAPGPIPDRKKPRGLREADYAQRIIELEQSLPKGEYTVLLERPFVVVGDEAPVAVRRHAEGTVRWAVEMLKADYFKEDPKEVLTIWLFKNDESYRRHASSYFGTTPSSPFGYYLASARALVMNISTGGGTLVHEIVHPFMATNFPACPAWFNEGLASLYEQSGERDGHIVGYPNWRLPGLQQVIRAGQLESFEALCGTSTEDFYDVRAGLKYAQARYLCYYLQERGLLVKYYREFSGGVNEDPTGYRTLQAVLGESDMAAWQKRWEAWVMTLGNGRVIE